MTIVKEAKRILREDDTSAPKKEKLPVSFITDFISSGWDSVGYLKANIEAIEEAYTGTKKITDLIQALSDAYLICIGQMEDLLERDDYIDYPEESGLATDETAPKENKKAEDDSKEDEIDPAEFAKIKAGNGHPGMTVDELNKAVAELNKKDKAEDAEIGQEDVDAFTVEEPTAPAPQASGEPFEFFVDFDEPEGDDVDNDGVPVSFKDIYNNFINSQRA